MKLFSQKNLIAIVACLCLGGAIQAQTSLFDTITTSQTWTKAMSPINVYNDITVPNTVTLNIEPGVEVIAQGRYWLKIEGQLLALGTESDSIVFTASTPASGWEGLRILANPAKDSTLLKYIVVEHSTARGILVSNTDKCAINNCLFRNNKNENVGAGLFAYNSNIVILNCLFINNMTSGDNFYAKGGGVGIRSCTVKIYGSQFSSNSASAGAGIGVIEGFLESQSNTFVNNHAIWGGAIYLEETTNSIISNSVFWHNSAMYSEYGSYGNNIYLTSSICSISNSAFDYKSRSIIGQGEYSVDYSSETCIELDTTNTTTNGPNFTDPAQNNFTLLWNSPLIDAGDTTGISEVLPAVDMNGEARIQRGAIDMGAFEAPYKAIKLVAIAGEHGSVSPKNLRVQEDSSLTFVIKHDDGYYIQSATYGNANVIDQLINKNDSLLFTVDNVVQSDTLFINFAIKTYGMYTKAVSNGTVTPNADTVDHGTQYVYTITPDEGYSLNSAYFGANNIIDSLKTADNSFTYTIDSVYYSDTLFVDFSINSYAINAIATGNGTVSPEKDTIEHNASITFTISANEGFKVSSATYNNTNVTSELVSEGNNLTYTRSTVDGKATFKVTFESIVGINTSNAIANAKAYPNPSKGYLQIDAQNIKSLKLYNLNGKVVYSTSNYISGAIININHVEQGVYYLQIDTKNGSKTEKIIIE